MDIEDIDNDKDGVGNDHDEEEDVEDGKD